MNVDQILFVLEEIGKECRVSEMKIRGAQVNETGVPEMDISLSSQRIHFMAGLLIRICFNNSSAPELSDLVSRGFDEEYARKIIKAFGGQSPE